MNLVKNKTQLDLNLEKVEESIRKVAMSLNSTAMSLNMGWSTVWELPDDQLKEILQYLYDNNKFDDLLGLHHRAATSVNQLLDKVGSQIRAKDYAGKPYKIENGLVSIEYPPVPEIEISIEAEVDGQTIEE